MARWRGPAGGRHPNALAERCRASVTVHLLLDGVGALLMPEEYLQLMLQAAAGSRTSGH